MSLAAKLLSASGGGVDKLFVDDVFSAYTYTGNGATQTINNGIDLAGKGGLVWTKCRSVGYNHSIIDTERGVTKNLASDATDLQYTNADRITALASNGFSLGASSSHNQSAATYVSWTFRKAPKFFDVVTYTGNGVAGRQIPHALGIAPGMVIVKKTSAADNWVVQHRSLAASDTLSLNSASAAFSAPTIWNSTAATASNFTVGTAGEVNSNTATYVAYLFAHDPSADGIVQCGSFTVDASGAATVNLGWEPQYLLTKTTSGGDQWRLVDMSRGMPVVTPANSKALYPNASYSEGSNEDGQPTSTGFKFIGGTLGASSTNIYLAIRRPNKPPTTGTQVYNAIARAGTGAAATVTGVGFAPDLVMPQARSNIQGAWWSDRLRGSTRTLLSTLTDAEVAVTEGVKSLDMNGASLGINSGVNNSAWTYINHFFKRAPGVFDVVCYSGTGVARTVAHNLGGVPELMLIKSRSTAINWAAYHGNPAGSMYLNLTNGYSLSAAMWNNTSPSASSFTVGAETTVNETARNYVAYLFATKAGISKVFSYTGNGSSLTVDCGFTTGARFVLIKRTDAVGDWYIWDTVRGLVAGNDPHLSLNTSVAEVTTNDSIDPASSGFIVNQLAATNINVTSGTYIGLAFA
jgi:hypothetical protein